MNILVTGGAGYIGSHCVRQLLLSGHHPVIVDDLSTGFKSLIQCDDFYPYRIHETDKIIDILKTHQVDAVMHFASFAYVGESIQNPEKYYENNVEGATSLLEAMVNTGVQKIIFSSSCTVYGDGGISLLDESLPMAPVNPYGETKSIVEKKLSDLAETQGLKYISFRYFNAAGAEPNVGIGECHDPETHLIPIVLQVASGQRDHIEVFGTDYDTPDGTCIRDYVHVSDIVQAHLLGLDYLNNGHDSDVFNIGLGQGFSVRQVIDVCEKVTGQKIKVIESQRREGDAATAVASSKKLREKLNWQPQYQTLESIIETAWQWENHRPQQVTHNSAGVS